MNYRILLVCVTHYHLEHAAAIVWNIGVKCQRERCVRNSKSHCDTDSLLYSTVRGENVAIYGGMQGRLLAAQGPWHGLTHEDPDNT